tara:strand:+ start:929 stop:3130 length:2202 start_codon:yes stop_codon:yes gene_type:complete
MSQKKLNQHDLEVSRLVKLFASGVTDKAIKQGLLVIEKFPNSYTLHNIMGLAYTTNSQFILAEKHYKESIKLNPKSSLTFTNYANLLKTTGKIDYAIENYKESITLDPKNYDGLNNLAITLFDKKLLHEAKSVLEEAIKVDPKNYRAYLNIGNVYKDLNLNIKAIENYKIALNGNENHLRLRNNLGLVLIREKRYEEAIKHYLFILKNDPNNINSLINLSTIYRNIGKLQKALKYIRKARLLNKEKELDATLYINKSAVELELGEFKKSIESNEEALKLNKNIFEAHDNSCLLMQKIGDYKNLEISYRSLYNQLHSSKEIISKNIILNKKLNNLSNIVGLIKNSGRTGSIFLHSLLDGHPEITTLPGVYLKGFFHPHVWEKIYIDSKNPNWRKLLIENFLTFYDALFDANSSVDVPGKPMTGLPGPASGLTKLGNKKDTILKIDKVSFSKHMLSYLDDFEHMERSTFFKLIHLAYEASIRRNNNPKLIFFHIHNPTSVESAQFIKDFPSVKFLQIIRDPVQALESWCKSDNKFFSETNNSNNQNNSYLSKFATVLNYFYNPMIEFSKETVAIKLEDLKLDSKKTMKKLSDWLEIKYNESMQIPSFQGNYYWGVSYIDPNIKGFSKDSINRKLGIFFSKDDLNRIIPLFYPYRKNYLYSKSSNEKFLKDIKNAENQINNIFDFEKEILLQSANNKERINAQLKGIRILMMSVINNIKNGSDLIDFPDNINNLVS